MAVSKMLLLQTELGQVQLFCNNGSYVQVRMSPNNSGSVATVRGVNYTLSLAYQIKDPAFGVWEQSDSYSSIRKLGTLGNEGLPTPTAKKKIESIMLDFVTKWCNSYEGKKLLAETEVQDRLEKVLSLTKKEAELKAQLKSLQQEIESAVSYLEQGKKEYGIE